MRFQDLDTHSRESQEDTGVDLPRQPVLSVDAESQQRKQGAVGEGQPAQFFRRCSVYRRIHYSAGEQSDIFVSKGWLCTKAKTLCKAPIQIHGVGWNIKDRIFASWVAP